MPAHRRDSLSVGGLSAGFENDGHAASAPIRHGLGSGQKHHDPVLGRVLDRDSGQPIGELARDCVGCSDTVLLRLQPPSRLVERDPELSRILCRVLRQRFIPRFDGLSDGGAGVHEQQ